MEIYIEDKVLSGAPRGGVSLSFGATSQQTTMSPFVVVDLARPL